MRLLINEPEETGNEVGMPVAGTELIDTMQRAAEVCLVTEGIDPDWVEISLSFVTAEEIHALNLEHRGVDRVTDVLSFPLVEDLDELPGLEDEADPEEEVKPEDEADAEDEADPEDEMRPEDEAGLEDWLIPLGDVVICLEQAEAQAAEYGHSRQREIVYLFVHSVLHLLGYDHMEPEEQRLMRAREEEIMASIGLTREVCGQ